MGNKVIIEIESISNGLIVRIFDKGDSWNRTKEIYFAENNFDKLFEYVKTNLPEWIL